MPSPSDNVLMTGKARGGLALAALAGFLLLAAEPAKPPAAGPFDLVERAAKPAALGISGASNPYDPEEIRVDVVIAPPDGPNKVLPCFWFVSCKRDFAEGPGGDDPTVKRRWERFAPSGEGDWRFRFRPALRGKHEYVYLVTQGGRQWRKEGGSFEAIAAKSPLAGRPGPIRLGKDSRYLSDAAGRTFLPVGHNLGWPDESGSEGYEKWMGELAAAGGNASRLWLVHYFGGTALEWSKSEHNAGYAGAGQYSQEAAARVDRILEVAEAKGVHLMLCFFSFGDHNWDWGKNPYNKQAGGWLETPAQFFTDGRARKAVRAMLHYAVARYGHSPSIWAWELWNEVETSRGYEEAAVTEWHREMAAEIRRLDAHKHLVTTSYRFAPPVTACAAYGLKDVDFAQVHFYGPHLVSGIGDAVRAAEKFGKPVVVGECGLWVSPNYFAADPAGLHLHDGAWASVFSGAAGGGMAWWWERFIHPKGLSFHDTGLARFLEGEDLAGARPIPLLARDSPERYFALALKSPRATYGWIGLCRMARWAAVATDGDARLERYGCEPASGPIEALLEGDFRGARRILFYDAFDGVLVGEAKAEGTEKGISIPVPAFRHDVAFKCLPADAAVPPAGGKPATPLHDRFEKMQSEAAANPPGP